MAVIAWVVIIVLVVFFVVPMSNEVKGWWVFSCLLLLLLSEVCALLSVYSALITAAIRSIFRPEKIVRDVILTPIKDELDCIIAKLVANYEKRHLEYALERVTFGIAQARLQLALGTGQLERVGITPLLLGTLLTGYTLWPKLFPDGLATDWSAPSNMPLLALVLGIGLGLVLAYTHAIRQHQSYIKHDHAVLALKLAVEAKKVEESSDSEGGPK